LARTKSNHKKFSFRRLSRRFLALLNLGVAVIFIIACLQPWLSPETYWFIGYLSIAFPYILLVLVGFMLFWLFAKKKYMLISFIALAIGYKQIGFLFSLRHDDFVKQKAAGDIRVMSWNIMGFAGFKPGVRQREQNADRIFALIREYKPDIICLQEYGQFEDKKLGRSYQELMKKMGYEHEVLSRDYNRVTYSYSSGLAIFSKYKIISSKRIPFRSSAESLIYVDVLVNDDTVRIFNTHLQSYRFSNDEIAQVEKIKDQETPLLNPVTSLLSKMKRAFRNRGAQVNEAHPVIDKSPHPQVVCIDMNDVPNSYAYWHMRGERSDAFLAKGFGIGRTYMAFLPTLRIDYILPGKQFEVTQMAVIKRNFSDHLPIVADLRLQK
jgi:endonuclease/exonuclease/phosphatase family metal-dependent hydrolase